MRTDGKPVTDNKEGTEGLLTFGGHLEVLRRMLFRIIGVTGTVAAAVFCMKDTVWRLLLAPGEWDFATYRMIERAAHAAGLADFRFSEYHVDLIATDLSSQFMTHVTTSVYLGLLGASPYILYELFRFISPALYDGERRYSVRALSVIYALFILGVLMSYYVLFPVSFRFLGTYSRREDTQHDNPRQLCIHVHDAHAAYGRGVSAARDSLHAWKARHHNLSDALKIPQACTAADNARRSGNNAARPHDAGARDGTYVSAVRSEYQGGEMT